MLVLLTSKHWPRCRDVSNHSNTIEEAKRIKELSIQEEVIVELDKVNAVLEHAGEQITKIIQ